MKKRSIFAMLVTAGTTWVLAKTNSQAMRAQTATQDSAGSITSYISELEPQNYTGLVHKTLEIFTFTTPAMTYHVADPANVIDGIAKEQGMSVPFYDLETCVRGVLSPKGQYGHLGHLDYQLNIVGRCDDYDYRKKTTPPTSNTDIVTPTPIDKTEVRDLEKSLNITSKKAEYNPDIPADTPKI